MTTVPFNDFDVLSPAVSGKLAETPSAFDDFWGVVTGFTAKVGEDEEDGKTRFYRQMTMNIRLDVPIGDVTEMWETYNLPTDPKTGEPLRKEDGSIVRPNKNSKWGVQEVQFDTSLGVPWEGNVMNIVGLHAHFVRKGTRVTRDDIAAGKRAPRGEPPYGRYIVEWDHYDNGVRQAAGLAAITTTFKSVVEEAVAGNTTADTATVSEEDARATVAKLAIGKTFLEQYQVIRKDYPDLAQYASRDAINQLVKDGLLVEGEVDGKVVYETGPAL